MENHTRRIDDDSKIRAKLDAQPLFNGRHNFVRSGGVYLSCPDCAANLLEHFLDLRDYKGAARAFDPGTYFRMQEQLVNGWNLP